MEEALQTIRELYAKAGSRDKQAIQEQLRDLKMDLFTEWETVFEMAIYAQQIPLIQIAHDLSLLTHLTTSPSALTTSTLSALTSCPPSTLQPLLSTMSSLGLIHEVSASTYTANKTTRILASPHVAGALPHIMDIHLPVYAAFPGWLKKRGYKESTGTTDLAFQEALGTALSPFEYLKSEPVQMRALGCVMMLDAVMYWCDSFPVEERLGGYVPGEESAVLVDIGGGFGAHSVALKKKFPGLPGRIVVQDLASTLAHVPSAQKVEGVVFQEHDFFTAQGIRGAKFYYLRHVLHDWPDDECVDILRKIVPAMGSESVVLVDEVVLPEEKVPWQVAGMTIAMMACLGGRERRRGEWEVLFERAGLRVEEVWLYDEDRFHSIVVGVPMELKG